MKHQDSNSKQVGGNHYKNDSFVQHWDWVAINGIGYLEGVASKYICRGVRKHESPVEDYEKSLHYVEKLTELFIAGLAEPRRGWLSRLFGFDKLLIPVDSLIEGYNLSFRQTQICHKLAHWSSVENLETIQDLIKSMIIELS